MTPDTLATLYRGYIACLNARNWARLGTFVHDEVTHNGRELGLSGYRAMLEEDRRAIPDLTFRTVQLVAQPPTIASRLHFDCRPAGLLFGLPVNGRRVRFDEHVFYDLTDGRIGRVWSIIDKAAIRDQL